MARALGVCLLAALLAVPLNADLEVPRDGFEFDAQLTGRGEKMNHGPFLSYSLISAWREPVKATGKKKPKARINPGLRTGKTPPVILRAINIRLGGPYMCAFDTEMCAMSAAWAGGFLDISQTNLNGYKGNDLAYLRPPVLLQNAITPGWSLDGSFADPRKIPHGAVPKTLAHYKGLYLHGNRTILAYTVGNSKVLELPAMLKKDKVAVFCRTIRLDTLPATRWLFVADLQGATGTISKDGQQATLTRKAVTLRAGVRGAPKGTTFLVKDERLLLKLPASKPAVAFKVFLARDVNEMSLTAIMKESGTAEDLPALCKGGPGRWKQAVTVKGTLGTGKGPYVVDTIPLPDDNPWKSWMRPGGFDFFSDGRAAVCTWNGDVWIVSGLDDKLRKVTWKRFATGLFEPLGLKIVKDVVYVLGRDQITRLHDLNRDGEADWYENFNNDAPTAPTFHGFAMELHTDSKGNFYYTRGAHRMKEGTPMHGGVIKVAADGSKAELICHGLREPAGLSVGPDDTVTVADNQGNWVPTSKIDFVKKGAFYGYQWGLKAPYPVPEKPLCWIPYKEDNSSGGQVWVTSDRWGPFKDHLLHTSYGTCKLFKVYIQRDGTRFQGGVTVFPLSFPSGLLRGQFHPRDGQLYLAGLKGWGTKAKTDGSFQRVRYTGKPVPLPTQLRVSKDTIAVTFPLVIDAKSVTRGAVSVRQWAYRYSKAYGSKDWCVSDPKKQGRDEVTVKAVSLSADGKTLTLTIPGLAPVDQMGITLKGLRGKDGTAIDTTIYNTINYIP